jgi:signal transduction histidine kinase/sensor domain CHASE-containing protein
MSQSFKERIVRQWRDPNRRASLGVLLLLVILLPLWVQANRWYEDRLLAEERSRLVVETSLYANAISAALNRRTALMRGLHAFVEAELFEEDFAAEFAIFANRLRLSAAGIHNIAVAPDGVVRYVYPLTDDNLGVVGYEPLLDHRPAIREDVQRAIDSQQVVLSGPYELLQGGIGLIARQAVFHESQYWGLLNIAFDLPPLLEESGLTDLPNTTDFILRDGINGEHIFAVGDLTEAAPVRQSIPLPDGEWELVAAPGEGWAALIRPSLQLFQGTGLIILLLLTGLTYLVLNRQAGLEQGIRSRTQELAKLNAQLQEELAHRAQVRQMLEQRVAERTRELTALLHMSQQMASVLELRPLLTIILNQLQTLVDYTEATISARREETYIILDYRGSYPPEQIVGLETQSAQAPILFQIIGQGQSLLIDDIAEDTPVAEEFRTSAPDSLEDLVARVRSYLAVPLMIKQDVVGFLGISHHQPHHYTDRDVELAAAVANQAAVAIENARLYEQAQQLAALQERQRLARELHDSVSQALYGIALGARTARTLLDRQESSAQLPTLLIDPLDYVLSLAEAGLAEMRTLIFELRPDSLETEGLTAALSKQTAALQARHKLAIETNLPAEPDVPLPVKEALYRVAQEALHNVVKHACAQQVVVRLWCEETAVASTSTQAIYLEIRDDGIGFDPAGPFPGHLGLRSMRERVERLDGELRLESQPGHGTRLWVRIDL